MEKLQCLGPTDVENFVAWSCTGRHAKPAAAKPERSKVRCAASSITPRLRHALNPAMSVCLSRTLGRCACIARTAAGASPLRPAAAALAPPRRRQSTEAGAASPKIGAIVDQISQLTLLETADLVSMLKVRRHRLRAAR